MSSPLQRLTKRQRILVFVGMAVAGIAAVAAARCDLRQRAPEDVRGNPEVWDRLTHMPGPSVAYLLFGRRRCAAPKGEAA